MIRSRGICPVCTGEFALRKDGMVGAHAGGRCDGARRAPAERPPSVRLADFDVRWSGVDSTTPAGHVLATGVDALGRVLVCLYEGSEPSDDTFKGSVVLPPADRLGATTTAYGRFGGYVVGSGDQTSQLARLAAHQQ